MDGAPTDGRRTSGLGAWLWSFFLQTSMNRESRMKHCLAALGLAAGAALSAPAHAATYHLSDCQPGAAAGCVPGLAANDGLSAERPKQLASQLPTLRGGDRVLFAQGGAWVNAAMRIYNPPGVSPTNRVMWDSYSPPWGGTAKPILTESRPGMSVFNFDDGGQKVADAGYEIRNLDLRGGGVMGQSTGANNGIFTYWAVNDLLVENVEISGFKIGLQIAQNPKAVGGWENQRIALRNSYVHDNASFSFLGGAADLVIENNILDRNGSAAVYDHDIYLSSVSRGVVRNNTITRSVLNSNGKCSGSVIVVHGFANGLTIENNRIVQPQNSTPNCYGIEISGGYADASGPEYFHDVVIRGNTVVDVGYVGIGARGCTGCVIENNSVVWTAGGGDQGISMRVNTPSSLDERGTALVIRNNSIYMQAASGTPTGIAVVNEGSNHTVSANVIYFGSGVNASARCFDTVDYTSASFKLFDGNACHRAGGPVVYSPATPSWTAARAAGFDVNGLNVDPLFAAVPSAANCYSLKVTKNSRVASIGNLQMARQPVAACSNGGPPALN
jgi:hypothetical protein